MSVCSITQNVFLEMVRGDTLGMNIVFPNLQGTIDEVTFTCRSHYGAPDVTFSGSYTGGEVTITDNNVYICIPPAYTENITPGMYVYDVEVQSGGGVFTPLIGNLKIIYGVTEV